MNHIYIYIYIYIYSHRVHHNPWFDLFIRHNNSFDNQGKEVNKNDIFLRFDIKNVLPTTHSISLHLSITVRVLEFACN